MKDLFFMGKVLGLISQGNFFKKIFAIALQILGIFVAVVGFVGWIVYWSPVFRFPFKGIIGGIIFQAIFAVAIYMVVHVLFIRAKNIVELPTADFTVIPIASILLKLIGEIYACFASAIGVGGCILLWFTGEPPWYLLGYVGRFLPFLRFGGGASFVGGLIFMVMGLLGAFFSLVFFYLSSELIVVLFEIANNTRATRQIAEQYDRSKT